MVIIVQGVPHREEAKMEVRLTAEHDGEMKETSGYQSRVFYVQNGDGRRRWSAAGKVNDGCVHEAEAGLLAPSLSNNV
jgi:hypothetical protein